MSLRASDPSGHLAADRSTVIASPDGVYAAVIEGDRIVVVDLQRAALVAELALPTTPEHTDVAWIGQAPRLLMLARRQTYSAIHLFDLEGPTARAEIQIEGVRRIGATVGPHALILGVGGTAVLTAGESQLTPYQFPGRAVPSAVGVAARHFVVAVAGGIEEWDPQQRTPRRRLRMPSHPAIAQLGGTERLIWLTTARAPTRIEVIAQVNRGQPQTHELPEPIVQVSGHPQRDLLACLGRDTGTVYVVDLDGRATCRTVDLGGMDRADAVALFAGPTVGVVAARAGQPLGVIALESRAGVLFALAQAPARAVVAGPPVPPDAPEPRSSLYDDPAEPAASAAPAPLGDREPAGDPGSPAASAAPAPLGEREPAGDPGSPAASAAPAPLGDREPAGNPGSPAASAAPPLPAEREPRPVPLPVATPPVRLAPPPRPPASPEAARPAVVPRQVRDVPADGGMFRLRRLADQARAATGTARPAKPAEPAEPARRGRQLTDAPTPPPVVRPPIQRAIAALTPRVAHARCTPAEYDKLLAHVHRFAVTAAQRAIAEEWDTGRLAYPDQRRVPYESEVLGIVGPSPGLAKDRVAEANAALGEAAAAMRAVHAALSDRVSPIDSICAEHSLSEAGEAVLLCVAAPALWGEMARLYSVLCNDAGRAICDEHLVWQLLGHKFSRREVARELDPSGPLIRHGLIRAGDRARPFQSLAADPIVVKLLAGSSVDADSEPGVTPIPATVALDALMMPKAVIDRALADLARFPDGRARVVVTGRSGSGRRTLLATLAGLAGRTLAMIDAATLLRDNKLGLLPARLQHAQLRGWLPCVDGLDTIASDDAGARGAVREILRDHHGPVTVRLPRHVPPPVEPGYVLIELPTSTIAERVEQWRDILSETRFSVPDLDELAARFTVGPGTIRNVVASVARGTPEDPGAALETALRQYLETKLGSVATRVTRLASWSQIVLPAEIQDSIVELLARIRHRRMVYDTWGFDQVMSTSRGLTVLFQGGPGTGKTLVASAIAHELGLDLYRIDLSRVMSKWIGETEQNLAKVFDAAEEGQALILFDEADSLFGKRTEVRTSIDRFANLETNFLLQRLDTFEGVAVLTTNFGTAIDAAFKRRLSARLTFPFPDEEAREQLWRVHLPKQMPLAGEFDLGDLARRYKMSGGYIRNAALRAAFLAAEENVPLSQDHLERAVRAEFREGGKLAESGILE